MNSRSDARYVQARGWTDGSTCRSAGGCPGSVETSASWWSWIEDLNGLGIAVVSLGEGIDCTTPAGKLQLHILAALGEFGFHVVFSVPLAVRAAAEATSRSRASIGPWR